MITTRADVDRAFRLACDAAMRCGVPITGWTLTPGSSGSGTQWTLWTRDRTVKLGFTRTDALTALRAMADAFEVVADSWAAGLARVPS